LPIGLGISTELVLRFVAFAVFVAIVYLLGKYLGKLVDKLMAKAEEELKRDVETVARFVVYAIGGLIAIAILSPQAEILASLLLLVGAALVVAFFEPLRNWGSYYSVRGAKPFKVGDWVEVDGIAGRVLEQNSSCLVLETSSGERVFVPNSRLARAIVVNKTTELGVVDRVIVRVPASEPLHDVVKEVRETLAAIKPELLGEPETSVSLGRDGSYLVEVRLRVLNARKLERVKKQLAEELSKRIPTCVVLNA